MKVQITIEQAQRLVLLHRELQAAAVRLNEAADMLAPGIQNGTLKEEDGDWYLTDEEGSEEQ